MLISLHNCRSSREVGAWYQFRLGVCQSSLALLLLCLLAGSGTSSTRKLLSTAGVTTRGCARSEVCGSPSWIRKLGWPRTTATYGWRRGTEAQVSHATPWDVHILGCPAWAGGKGGGDHSCSRNLRSTGGAWTTCTATRNSSEKLNAFYSCWPVRGLEATLTGAKDV